ncbi:MAG: hypothetical protein MUF20_10660 [Methylotetracoccus sp.]|jgi:hypothetical protein|nr:hypothetical protein [Methylotetracoccus sp.]
MKRNLAAALSLTLALAATPALAQSDTAQDDRFAALSGIEVEALSQAEMDSIEGARITAGDLLAAALANIKDPKLRTQVTTFITSKAKKLSEVLAGLRKP